MDQKLAAYRAKIKREELITSAKEKIKSWLPHPQNRSTNSSYEDQTSLLDDDGNDDTLDEIEVLPDEEIDKIHCFTYRQLIKFAIIFVIWSGFFLAFVKFGFGSVYFVVSCIVGICLNTRTRKREKNEVSAYSVFNRNCESIQGTVKAEDLERQMIFGRLF